MVKLWLLLFLDQIFEGADTLCRCNLDLEDVAGFIAVDKAVQGQVDGWWSRGF